MRQIRIGPKRKRLSAILKTLSGFEYPPEGITQQNCTISPRSRCWSDPAYWLAMPKGHGAVLVSPYTMADVIKAFDTGGTLRITGLSEVVIHDSRLP